ncbi:ABC transporter permease [Kitasatospora sp. NPDC048538]|uniref:ABC transporter permease n=1 Tax=unclassified Kitasatospora TaxID=2633591 RepID=UPI0033E4D2DF
MTAPARAASVPGDAAEPRARFRDLLAAEWITFWSLRSTPAVLLLGAAVIVATAVRNARDTLDHYVPGTGRPDTMRQVALDSSFSMVGADVVLLVAGGLGALVLAGEYASGRIRTSLAAVPDRCALLLAKALVLTGVLFAWAAAAVGTAFGVDQALLSDRGIGLSVADPGALRFLAAAVLLAMVCALVGLAVGVLVRHSAASVVGTILVLFFLPSLFTDTYRWTADVSHALPFTAWRRLATLSLAHARPSDHPATVAGSWTALALWALASLLLAVLVIRRRDH